MADSVLKLKVDDKEYNASLKNAKTGMQALEASLQKAGKTFNDCDKKVVEYVRAIGNMETQSKSARGRIGEMSTAFVELSQQYNKMTKDVQQSDVGKALSESMTTLRQRTIEAKQELAKLESQLREVNNTGLNLPDMTGGGGGLFSGGKLDGMLQVFGGNLMTKAAGAVASLGQEMYGMVQQGIELAKQGEGIRIAFERLGRGDILDGLRQATHGTVTDLELMKAAVKFDDFNLPVEQLGTLLAFAQKKAKDTGQSVDYMVDSIVTGLGRKSLMILDNLGLSAAEIKERMAETGDMTKAVGAIIRDQMAKAGDYVETAADRATAANVSLQNKMEELGRKFAPLEEASNSLWTSMKIGILDVVGGPLANLLNKLTEAGRLMNAYGQMGGSGKVGRMTANLAGAREQNRQSVYQQQQQQFWKYINPREQQLKDIRAWQSGDRSEALAGRVQAIIAKYGSLDATKIQAEIDAAKKMLGEYQQAAKGILTPVKADIDTSGAVQSVDTLRVKLAELEAQRKNAIKSGDQDKVKTLTQQINQTKTSIKALDPTALSTRTSKEDTQRDRVLSQWLNAEAKAAKAVEMYNGQLMLSTEAEKLREKQARETAAAAKKLSDAETERATALGGNDLKAFYVANKKVAAAGGTTESATGFTATTANIDAFIDNLKERIANSEVGTDLYNALTAQLADATALSNLLQTAIKNGIDPAQIGLDPKEFWSKVFGENPGDYIEDKTWQGIIDEMNKAQKKGGKKIQMNANTGEVTTKEDKGATEQLQAMNTMISSLGSIATGVQNLGIEVPQGITQSIAVLQTIMGIVSAIQTMQTVGTFLGIFANGGIVHAAGGYRVPGNSMSGDNVPALLNSGELVLNRAQQGNLASQLEGDNGGGGMRIVGVLKGHDMALMLDRWGMTTGRGELLFGKNL